MAELHPILPFLAVAILLPFLPKRTRAWVFLVPPIVALFALSRLEEGTVLALSFLEWEIVPLRVDRLSLVFGWVFSIAGLLGGIYALHLRDRGQQVAALLYVGAALGVVFAGDLFTLFVFWEIMAVASAVLVWARRTEDAYRSGMRYIYVHLFGGSLLLAGILLYVGETGSLTFEAFQTQSAATWLIFLGFCLNAAVPPLHAWLADAYPAATVTGAVFMCAFTTKTAVYTLVRGFPGWEILVVAGVLMALYGTVYAVLADDIRRLIAYSIVSQVGYMVTGVGLGTETAINGATAHAFTHILYKGLLFMATGAVLYATGRSKLSELGGLAKYMRWTLGFYLVGALSISAFPFLSGFVSKSVTIEAAELLGRDYVVILLYLASIGTFLHTGLKLPYLTWWGRDREYELRPIPWNMLAAMGLAAAVNVFLGLFPGALYAILPYPLEYEPYTFSHVLKSVQLLGFAFVAFWLLKSRLAGRPLITLDTDWFYRRPARLSWNLSVAPVERFFAWWETASWSAAAGVARIGRDPVGWLRSISGAEGVGAVARGETPSTTFRVSMALMVLLLLGLVLAVTALVVGGW